MISAWTNTYSVTPKIYAPKTENDLKQVIKKKKNIINFGNGRSYGDNCINKNNVISMKNFKKILFFDKKKGKIEVESGVLLSEVLKLILKNNWFFPTSPGTKFVTIGGLVANNVHGKNINQKNFFYDYINTITLILPNGKKIFCSKKINKKIFDLTIGGMGLTGTILSVNFSLKKISSLEVITKKIFNKKLDYFKNIEKKINISSWDYAVIWLDTFRYNNNINSITFLAKHTKKKSNLKINNSKNISFIHEFFFRFFNNFLFYRIVNYFYVLGNKIFNPKKQHLINYFYKFDNLKEINKIFGNKGFIQFQFQISKNFFFEFMNQFYNFSENNKIFSNLIVIKLINQKSHYLSMYGRGFSISMDFKNDKNKIKLIKNFFLSIGKKYKFQFNLSKDLSLNKKYFENNKNFKNFKKNMLLVNKNFKFKSMQSDRIGLTNVK